MTPNDTHPIQEYEYTLTDRGAVIDRYLGTDGDVAVPSLLGGLPVVGIAPAAFQRDPAIRSIVLPETLSALSDGALAGLGGAEIFFPASLVSVTPETFGEIREDRPTSIVIVPADSPAAERLPEQFRTIGDPPLLLFDSEFEESDPASLRFLYFSVDRKRRTATAYVPKESPTAPSPGECLFVPSHIAGIPVERLDFRKNVLPFSVRRLHLPATLRAVLVDDAEFSPNYYTAAIDPDDYVQTKDFAPCLNRLVVDSKNPHLSSDGRALFSKNTGNGMKLLRVFCRTIRKYTVPKGVSVIAAAAFLGCTRLEGISFPDSLREIGPHAFHDCGNLRLVLGMGPMPDVAGTAFLGTPYAEQSEELIYGTTLVRCTVSDRQVYVVPDGITKIADGCFLPEDPNLDDPLTEIVIPASVKEFGNNVLAGRTSIRRIRFAEGVLELPDHHLWSDVQNPVTLVLPSTLLSVFQDQNDDEGDFSFFPPFKNVAAFEMERPSAELRVENGILYSADGTALLSCPSGRNLTELRLPRTVCRFAKYACTECATLERVIGMEQVAYIPANLFLYCKNLREIDLSKTVSIGDSAFWGCTSLETVDLSSVISISDNAFYACSSLKHVDLPESLADIGDSAFESCGIEKVILPRALESLGSGAFADASEITVYDSIGLDGKFPAYGVATVGRSSFSEISAYTVHLYSAETEKRLFSVHYPPQNDAFALYDELKDLWRHDGTFDFPAYDALFPRFKDPLSKTIVALNRLSEPTDLARSFDAAYRRYLSRNMDHVVQYAKKQNSIEPLCHAAELGCISAKNIDRAIAYADRSGFLESVTFLLTYQNEHFAALRKSPSNLSLKIDPFDEEDPKDPR